MERTFASGAKSIAIIGAGIGGLSVARRLLQRGYTGRISIYDKGAAVGGRLMSQRIAEDRLLMELGAGRFQRHRHPRMYDLCSQLGLPLQRFDYPTRYRATLGNNDSSRFRLNAALSALKRARKDPAFKPGGFAEFCRSVIGEDLADQLRAACGYDSLLHPDIPIEAGFSILDHHPETESLFHGDSSTWLALRDGLQSLAQALARDVGDDVDLYLGAELKSIERPPQGGQGYRLRFSGDRGAFRDRADLVIVAALPQDAQTIQGWPVDGSNFGQAELEGIPLLKGYVQYDRGWWQDAWPGSHCVIADTPVRKLYVTAGSRTLWFYCDGKSARRLDEILAAYGTLPPELLEQHIGCRPPPEAATRHCRWKLWDRGIGFYRNPPALAGQYGFLPLAPNLLLCSDIFTSHLGWAEGCLVSADAAVRFIESTAGLRGREDLALVA